MNQTEHVRLMDDPLARAERALLEDIPLARALGVEIVRADGERVDLTAPFEPNRNGHGTLFGGSAVSVALIAGWLLVHGWVEEVGVDADVVIHELDARFDTPIVGDVRARATAPPPEARRRFEKILARRGRARIEVPIRVGGGEVSEGTALVGRYAALRRPG